jgi:uncharacterized membrane protein
VVDLDPSAPVEPNAAAKSEAAETDCARTEASSDGVFAVAITLLILDLRVPASVEGSNLADALCSEWPSFFAFVTSFLTILIIWINHHRLFNLIRRVARNFLDLNGLLLLTVTLVPFGTALVAEHVLGPEGRLAAAIYAGIAIGIALTFNGVWRYAASGRRLQGPQAAQDVVARINREFWFGPAL